MNIPTPHIEAKNKEDFAKTVIMPGDPRRAEWIVKTFLTDSKLVTAVRGILGFTGLYKGKKVSVMASGMGNPSMGIYSYELFKFYDVDNIIRIGTCGACKKELDLGSIILSKSAITNTNYCDMFKNNITSVNSNEQLFNLATKKAEELRLDYVSGNTFCTDTFYAGEEDEKLINQNKCLATEMETAALYYNANLLNKNALTICSVSDNLVTKKSLSSIERQNSLKDMVLLALEVAIDE